MGCAPSKAAAADPDAPSPRPKKGSAAKTAQSDKDRADVWLMARNNDVAGLTAAQQAGVDTNAIDQGGRTPLHHAAQEGSVEVALWLLDNGALTMQLDNFGMSPREVAEFANRETVVALLEVEEMESDTRRRNSVRLQSSSSNTAPQTTAASAAAAEAEAGGSTSLDEVQLDSGNERTNASSGGGGGGDDASTRPHEFFNDDSGFCLYCNLPEDMHFVNGGGGDTDDDDDDGDDPFGNEGARDRYAGAASGAAGGPAEAKAPLPPLYSSVYDLPARYPGLILGLLPGAPAPGGGVGGGGGGGLSPSSSGVALVPPVRCGKQHSFDVSLRCVPTADGDTSGFEARMSDGLKLKMLLTMSADPELASITGHHEEEVTLKRSREGWGYTASFNPTIAGEYTLTVLFDFIDLFGSPAIICANSGEVEAEQCQAEGTGLTTAVAGQPAHFVIFPRDEFGNSAAMVGSRAPAAPSFVVSVVGSGSTYVSAADHRSDGSQPIMYQATVSGPYEVYVALEAKVHGVTRTTQISGSPFSVNVVGDSQTAAGRVVADGSGVKLAAVAQPAAFTIRSFDSYGNPIAAGGDAYSVALEGCRHTPKVEDMGDGTYTVAYNTYKSGRMRLDVSLSSADGLCPISGSPFYIFISPDAVAPQCCIAAGGGISSSGGVECQTGTFTVTARDAYNNPIIRGGLSVDCTASFKVSGLADTSQPIKCVARDNGDGTYLVAWTPPLAGDYAVRVDLNDRHGSGPLRGSPFHVHVQPRKQYDGGGGASAGQGSSSGTGGKTSAAQMQQDAINKKKAADENRKARLRDMQRQASKEGGSDKDAERARFHHQQSERQSNDGNEQWSDAQQTAEEERRRAEARRKFKEQYKGKSNNSQKRQPPPNQRPHYDPSQGYGSYEHPNHNSYAKFAHDFGGGGSSGGSGAEGSGYNSPPNRSSYVPQASASSLDPAKAKDIAKWTERLRRFEEISKQSDQPGERKNAERLAKDARQRLEKLKS